MTFVLEIKLGNDGLREFFQIASVLRRVALVLGELPDSALKASAKAEIEDINGKHIGKWEVR